MWEPAQRHTAPLWGTPAVAGKLFLRDVRVSDDV